MTMRKYTLVVTNEPDGDGHYAARVHVDGVQAKVVFDSDRAEAIARATRWAQADAAYDPSDVQRIELDPYTVRP